MRQKDSIVVSPRLESLDQQRSGAASGSVQFVDDPQHAVYAQAGADSDLTEQSIASQQNATVRARGDQAQAVIGRQGSIALLECESLSDLVWRQIVGHHPDTVELPPLLIGEIKNFRFANGERDYESIRKITEYGQ